MVKALVCLSKEYQVNHDGKLIYRLKYDMKNFKEITTKSRIVIMGKNTYLEGLKDADFPLKNRLNIVLTRTKHEDPDIIKNSIIMNNTIFLTYEEIKKKIINNEMDCCIIGGMKTYRLFEKDIDQWIITRVLDDEFSVPVYENDIIFPHDEIIGPTADTFRLSTTDTFQLFSTKCYYERPASVNRSSITYKISVYNRRVERH